MMFFFKRKKIILEAYAPTGDLIDYFPLVRTNECTPEWFQNLPKGKHNVRNCMGIKDLWSEGFMIPAWADHHISVYPDNTYNVQASHDQKSPASNHNLEREATGAWPDYINIKLHNPWFMWCDKPIKWLITQPVWHQSHPTDFIITPGVLEFRHNHQMLLNTLFKKTNTPYLTKIKAGDSLAQVIPITDEPFELELKVMTNDAWVEKFSKWNHSFEFGYQKIRKKFENKN